MTKSDYYGKTPEMLVGKTKFPIAGFCNTDLRLDTSGRVVVQRRQIFSNLFMVWHSRVDYVRAPILGIRLLLSPDK